MNKTNFITQNEPVIPVRAQEKARPASFQSISYSKASVALLIFMLFFIIMTLVHEKLDTIPASWDEAMYLGQSELLFKSIRGNDTFSTIYYGVAKDGPLYIFEVFSRLMGGYHAPLILILPIFSYFLLGPGTPAITLTLILLFILFSLVLYYSTARLFTPLIAFFAVVITSTMPLTVGLSMMFLVEYGMMILVCLWVFMQRESDHFLNNRFIIPLGSLLGIGMLMKVTFPLYIIGPITFGILSEISKSRNRKHTIFKLLRNGAIIFVLGVLVMGISYLPNLQNVINYGLSASFGQKASNYSIGALFSLSTLKIYWLNVVNNGISAYYFFILLLFIGIKVVLKTHFGQSKLQGKSTAANTNLWFLLCWFLVPFLFLSFSVNKEVRFLLPAFPALGILIAWLVTTSFTQFRVRLVVITMIIIFPCAFVVLMSLPIKTNTLLRAGPFIFVPANTGLAKQPVSQNWKLDKIIGTINDDAHQHHIKFGAKNPLRIVIIPSHKFLNANTLVHRAIHKELPFLIFYAPPVNSTKERTDQLLFLQSMEYIITKSGNSGPAYAINSEISQALIENELHFSKIRQFDMPDNSKVTIFRNNIIRIK